LNTAGSFSQLTQCSLFTLPLWPSSQGAAILIPGSRQWTAEQGCYVVNRMETSNLPISEQGFPIQPFYDCGDVSTNLNLGAVPTIGDGDNNTNAVFSNVFWDSFDQRGAIFSGLSLQTTLTVNMMWLVERQPDPTISDLVVLARPPPERDNIALDLYTHISDHLPAGVPVGENGLGDWFMDALSTAADFVAPVLSCVPGVGGAIGMGISSVNSAYKKSKEPKYETNTYVAPPIAVPRAMSRPHVVEKVLSSGRVVEKLSGGSAKNRVALRQRGAAAAHQQRNASARRVREKRVNNPVNPFKGKSIPR